MFRDSFLADDVNCVKQIFSETEKFSGNGFTAWVAWKSKCKGRNLDTYTAGCFADVGPAFGNKFSDPDDKYAFGNNWSGFSEPSFVQTSFSKQYGRCELARELVYEHGFSMNNIQDCKNSLLIF